MTINMKEDEKFTIQEKRNFIGEGYLNPAYLIVCKSLLLVYKNRKQRKYKLQLIEWATESEEMMILLRTLLRLTKKKFLTINKFNIIDNGFEDSLLQIYAQAIENQDKNNIQELSLKLAPPIVKLFNGSINPNELENFIENDEWFDLGDTFQRDILENLEIELEINKDQMFQIQNLIDRYITAFTENKLGNYDRPRYEFQRKQFLIKLKQLLEEKQPNKLQIWTGLFQKQKFRMPEIDFIETAFAIEKERIIDIIWILFSKEENQCIICNVNEEKFNQAISSITQEAEITKNKSRKTADFPYCLIEGGIGYFKFYKEGKKIKIGGQSTRHFRLLQCLCEPVSVAKTIDSVFEAIRLPKDKHDERLNDDYLAKNRKIELIQYTIKELQKNKDLQRKLKFKFNNTKTTVQLEI